MPNSNRILATIVVSQFCCTSLWFAGNGIINDLISQFSLGERSLGHLTSSVQFGFITGTLFFAVFSVADRFSPSKVFFVSALFAGLINLGMLINENTLFTLIAIRTATGFFLAGIYPVGMKIAADHFEKGLGKSLGLLVGALVLGTAFPHLVKAFSVGLDWQLVVYTTAGLSVAGGLSILLWVPDGPYRKKSSSVRLSAFFKVFTGNKFRSASFGYFGHMWELYAFWTFVPFVLANFWSGTHDEIYQSSLAFLVIAIGGPACAVAGYLSLRLGSKSVAYFSLLISGLCCLLSPLVFQYASPVLLISFLLIWGITVISDSPLFSTLVANNADPTIKGTALTIVNCIGFSITIFSIQLLNSATLWVPAHYIFLFLVPGPIFGLLALRSPFASR